MSIEKIKESKLYEIGLWLYHKVNDRILDYRYKVPGNAGMCFAYYLMMSIIPICSLSAFLANMLNVDLNVIAVLLRRYLTKEFADIIIIALQPTKIRFSSIIVIGMSIFVVSRGINQLYGVSKSLFPPRHNRPWIIEQFLLMVKTVLVFILLLLIIALLAVIPIINNVFNLKGFLLARELTIFLSIFLILFMLYWLIPDVKVHFMDIVVGSGSAAFLFTVLVTGLSIYFGIVDYHNVYGSLASIVMILLSFTFCAEVIYIGMYMMFEAHMKRLIDKIQRGEADWKDIDY